MKPNPPAAVVGERGGIPWVRRVPASQQTSERIEQMIEALEAHREGPSLTQLALRKIVEELLEADVSERLGRGYYAHHQTELRLVRLDVA